MGDIFVSEKLEEQKTRIRDFYERQGYFNTIIHVITKPASIENGIRITFHIYKGDRYRYSQVNFEGVKTYPESRLKSFIPVHSLYSDKRLKNWLNKITN